jgi:putative thiamine transport system ATP-binding protein
MRGLRIEQLRLAIGERVLLDGFDLAVAPGAVTTVTGPSGCGKSSLLSYLCGTLDPAFAARGRIWLDGVEIDCLPPERRRLGILFQDDLLFPHLSVGENLAFALRDPATLSGGQRARVALMRTLLAEPRALLLDEPFAKLDQELRHRVRRFVFDHAREAGLPTLLVTHDRADAEAAAGAVIDFPPLVSPANAKLLHLRNSRPPQRRPAG